MDQQQPQRQPSRWQAIGRRVLRTVLLAVVIGVALVVLIRLIRIGYAYQWTGFGRSKVNEAVEPSKTLWDWLDLLIVPIVLAIGGYLFTRFETRRTQRIANQQSQDATLQAYLGHIESLFLDENASKELHSPKRERGRSTKSAH